MTQKPNVQAAQESAAQEKQLEILGLSTGELAGLSVDELIDNKTAITMMLHYYKVMAEENAVLRNDLNTARTYVAGYDKKKDNAATGAILLLVANVGIGFGVNLLTGGTTWPGLATLMPGLVLAAAGLYFSFKER